MSEKELTWKQKLNKGIALDPYDEIKADADFNYRQRLREAEEKKAFEELKNQSRETSYPTADEENEDDKKGKK